MIDLDALIDTIKQCKHVPEAVATELCEKAIELLIQEGNVVAVQAPMTVCGDIHGQLHDLLTLFDTGGLPPQTQYLFLGDFVDRGFYLVELFLLLLAYKVRYPDRITLIRGNHELRQITTVYGFYDECVRKYGLISVWRRCCDVFDYLALGAIIQGYGSREGVFCVHGGLSPVIDSVDQIRVLDRKQEVPHEGAMCDLLWLDPEDVDRWSVLPRGAGYLFGSKQTKEFLHGNRLSLVARAHQLVMEGYREMFNGDLVTVWLAPNYCYRCGNVALVLVLDEQLEREYRVFEAAPHDSNVTTNYKPAVEYFI